MMMRSLLFLTFLVAFALASNADFKPSQEALDSAANLREEVDQSHLLHHEFLECYSKGGYKDMMATTRLFAINHYAYSRNFIKYLIQVREKLAKASPEDVHLISENMDEEMGHYSEEDFVILGEHNIDRHLIENIPHKVLIKHFLETVGVSAEDFNDQTTIGAVFTQDIINIYDKSNACEALAIIGFAIEQTVSTLYSYLWEGLKTHTPMNPDDFVFFPLHILVDDGHAEHIQDAYAALYTRDPESCANAGEVVKQVLDRRSQMFTDLKAHVEEETGGLVCK